MLAITKATSAELGPLGITVNAICPGMIKTNMTLTRHDHFEEMGKLTPAMRAGEAEDIAQVVWWLCTPAAGFVQGENVVVDGGWTKILAADWVGSIIWAAGTMDSGWGGADLCSFVSFYFRPGFSRV